MECIHRKSLKVSRRVLASRYLWVLLSGNLRRPWKQALWEEVPPLEQVPEEEVPPSVRATQDEKAHCQ